MSPIGKIVHDYIKWNRYLWTCCGGVLLGGVVGTVLKAVT